MKRLFERILYQDILQFFVQCFISLNVPRVKRPWEFEPQSKPVIKNDKKEGWGFAQIHSQFDIVFPDWNFFLFFLFSFFYFAPFISTRTQWRLNGSWMLNAFFVRQLGLVFFKVSIFFTFSFIWLTRGEGKITWR